jgi:hypothetical protein
MDYISTMPSSSLGKMSGDSKGNIKKMNYAYTNGSQRE